MAFIEPVNVNPRVQVPLLVEQARENLERVVTTVVEARDDVYAAETLSFEPLETYTSEGILSSIASELRLDDEYILNTRLAEELHYESLRMEKLLETQYTASLARSLRLEPLPGLIVDVAV